MIDVAEDWLKSKKYAEIAGCKLRPLEHPQLKGMLITSVRGQAQAFYLTDDSGLDWILKKFSPARIPDSTYINAIQSLIPHRPGLQAGYLRRILAKGDVKKSGYFNPEFAAWIENTVQMPRIKSDDWAGLADKLRDGSVKLAADERLLLCTKLSEQINLLESNELSHRDLSATNVFVDVSSQLVNLIDWDCIFHPSLTMPSNTTFGTNGYIAPFARVSGALDPQTSWKPRADRFSMAILNAEFLSMDIGTPIRHDGGMFEQAELFNRGGPATAPVISGLRRRFPRAAILLEQALKAQGFDDCPSPAEWIALAATPIPMPSLNLASTFTPAAASQPQAAPPVNSNSFALLDEAAFAVLDERAFVPLI